IVGGGACGGLVRGACGGLRRGLRRGPARARDRAMTRVRGGEPDTGAGWDVIIPIKRLDTAKSRLAGGGGGAAGLAGVDDAGVGREGTGLAGVDDALRQRLALSFATDACAAALAVPAVRRVLVVTEDPVVAAQLSERGAQIVGETRGPGLNPAIEAG